MSSKLAIKGGPKVREKLFPNQNTIGPAEIEAATYVLKDGLLTGFQANADRRYGGPQVRHLTDEWGEAFNAAAGDLHCVPVNSCTSGLVVACGAAGIRPGDEVIVTPYSMTCSATAPMVWGGVPVFADVDPLTFNLDPDDVERKITKKTRAILVVDLFGHPYDRRIDEVAKKHGLVVIEDAAQAVGATRDGYYAGTLGHMGVYSFNLGKHLTCGEGGMICTYDPALADRCNLLMNHAESVVNDLARKEVGDCMPADIARMYGFNLRMTEVSAAILRAQLARRGTLIGDRVMNAQTLGEMLARVPGLKLPHVADGCTHTHYVYPLLFDEKVWGMHRDKAVAAVRAELTPCAGREWEGVTISGGYITPLWKMPVFQSRNYPDRREGADGMPESITPVCERLWRDELIVTHRFFGPNATKQSLRDVYDAFQKVYENRKELL